MARENFGKKGGAPRVVVVGGQRNCCDILFYSF